MVSNIDPPPSNERDDLRRWMRWRSSSAGSRADERARPPAPRQDLGFDRLGARWRGARRSPQGERADRRRRRDLGRNLAAFRRPAHCSGSGEFLLAENEALRNEIEQLRRGPRDQDGWHSVRDHRAQARWCLDLHADGEVCLNDLDQEFLSSISRWSGDLPKGHEAILSKVVADVCRCTRQPAP